MSNNALTEEHKATMRRHFVESRTLGVPEDEIRRELRDEVFKQVGKYSMAQISSTLSWIHGPGLSGKRVNDVVWNEGPDDTNEDGNFDNPQKNGSRDWQIEQLTKHTTLEARGKMNYLLLPGQNEYDLEAFTRAGLQGKNLLTYILGNHPKAVAQYLRNCRRYGVQNRRVGAMNTFFPQEPGSIQGAYIDYFGQLCPDYAMDAALLPIDANCYPICLGYNFKKGREHPTTKVAGRQTRAQHGYVDANVDRVTNGMDLLSLYYEGERAAVDDQLGMAELRDDMVYSAMFAHAGVAQQRNWVAPDLVKSFTTCIPGNEDLNDLPLIQQYGRVREQLRVLITLVSLIDQHANDLNIHIWMSDAAAGIARGVVNMPVIRHLAEPSSYISGESKQPFRSYFGVLETKKSHYEKYIRAIEFMFTLGTILMKKSQGVLTRGRAAAPVQIVLQELMKVTGVGSRKQITVLDARRPVAEINHDYLMEARMELGISSCSAQNPQDTYDGHLENEVALIKAAKARGKVEEAINPMLAMLTQGIKAMTGGGQRPTTGRNSPCVCGSGRKYKHCCRNC
jgi:SEC-C motif